jgi:hypothetical protein
VRKLFTTAAACQEEPESWKMWEIDFRCVRLISDVLKESRSWNNNPSEDHPVVALLRDERKKRKKTKKDGCGDSGGRRIIFLQ